MDRTALVTLEVARNRHNIRCARSQVAILLASLIFINSQRRQPTSMLFSFVVIKALFVPKRGTEIDEDVLCPNMSKTRFPKSV